MRIENYRQAQENNFFSEPLGAQGPERGTNPKIFREFRNCDRVPLLLHLSNIQQRVTSIKLMTIALAGVLSLSIAAAHAGNGAESAPKKSDDNSGSAKKSGMAPRSVGTHGATRGTVGSASGSTTSPGSPGGTTKYSD